MVIPAGAATRRTLLKASVAGLGVMGLGGCGGLIRLKVPPRAGARDAELLNTALAAEQRSIAAYTASAPLLGGFGEKMAGQFLAEELAHAGVLRKLIRQVGGHSHSSRGYQFGRPGGRAQLLGLLHSLERDQITIYLDAISRLSTPYLRQTVAAILANDAQHVTVLRAQQGMGISGPLLTASE